ncbi:MAG: choice-of-anchor D domain-containing protein [bacterium]
MNRFLSPFLILITLPILLLLSSRESLAVQHIVLFGGNVGHYYSPQNLEVVVGDTVLWKADGTDNFSVYDLHLVTFPAGAIPFAHVTSGVTFRYIVKVAGEYDYQSDTWSAVGMSGSIIAVGIHNGLTNEGKEFYLGMIYPNYNAGHNQFFHAYAMVNSYYPTEVTINYYDALGSPLAPKIFRMGAKSSLKIPLDTLALRIDTSLDAPAYNSCHIVSTKPITVEYLSVGQCSGGSYLALPAITLGKKYVAACYNDNPGDGYIRNPNFSGGAVIVIGTVDGTHVQIVPTTTTTTGHVGAVHGIGTNHTPVPFSLTLNKGQTYFFHSSGDDTENDMSGSIIEANNPVVVISGNENAFLGDKGDAAIEGRDFMVEQMVPYEQWDSTGYISIPFVEPTAFAIGGHGDSYRVYSYDEGITPINFEGISQNVSRYNFAESGDVTTPTEVSSANGKKISVMQYDERSQPTTKPWPAPSMMTVVPRSHWKRFFSFNLLDNQNIGQIIDMPYINVISDHLESIKVSYGSNTLVPIGSLIRVASFNNPSQSDASVTAAQYRLTAPIYNPAAAYNFFSEYPFMVYLYEMRIAADVNVGRPEDPNVPHEYAAPAGMQMNTGVETQYSLSVDSVTKCSSWHIKVRDLATDDPGIKAVILNDDPDGVFFSPGAKVLNATFDQADLSFTNGELHPAIATGADAFEFDINVINPLLPALAPVAIIDNRGNARYFQLNYKAPTISLNTDPPITGRADSIVFPIERVGQQICTTFVISNTAADGGKPIRISTISLKRGGGGFSVAHTSKTVPFEIAPQTSDSIQVCFSATDTLRHRDSLLVQTDCFAFSISLDAHGRTGLILSPDVDFGFERVSRSSCKDLLVRNIGNAPLTIQSLSLSDDSDFTISAQTRALLPITIKAGGSVNLTICFAPHADIPYSEKLTIKTDLVGSFENSIKSFAYLSGVGGLVNSVAMNTDAAQPMLRVLPNPARGSYVNVLFPEPLQARSEVILFDVLGRRLWKSDAPLGTEVFPVPLDNLTAGTYHIELITHDRILSGKFEYVK